MKNNSIITYQTNIHINIVDKQGKITSQNFGEKFDSLDMMLNRQKAIEYLRSRINYFYHEEPMIYCSSPLEAELKGYKDFTSLSVSIEITDANGQKIDTDGSLETVFEFLSCEHNILNHNQNLDFIIIEDNYGDSQKIIKVDYDFFESLIN